jgi:trimethylamine:corrinoid methyltransferase-like protein
VEHHCRRRGEHFDWVNRDALRVRGQNGRRGHRRRGGRAGRRRVRFLAVGVFHLKRSNVAFNVLRVNDEFNLQKVHMASLPAQ